MNNLISIAAATMCLFFLFKMFFGIIFKFLPKQKKDSKEFDIWFSMASQIFFVLTWLAAIQAVTEMYGISDLEFYISFCLIGVSCVFWCYFSWSVEHIFINPHIASAKDRKIKKILIYLLIFIFVLIQGYQQVLHLADSSYEIDILFSYTNYSVIVATIALDRILNQLLSN